MAALLTNEIFAELKNHSTFTANSPTLEELMLKGEEKDRWVDVCEKVGQLLATTRSKFNNLDPAQVFPTESIRKRSVLGEWIDRKNSSWDDTMKSIAPESRFTHLDLESIRKRGNQAAELIQKGNSLNLNNLLTKQVQLPPGQQDIQINFNEVDLVYGPLGLETAAFLADVLIKYYHQLHLEHSIRYVTSDCAKSFGRAFDDKLNLSEADRKTYWAQTSLLTGWEIIRRVTEDQAVRVGSQQNLVELVDVFEAGLRLIYNSRIDNVGFMILVALAEL